MPDAETLRSLLERVEGATADNRPALWSIGVDTGIALDIDIATRAAHDCAVSLDAALDLLGRVLPGWLWMVSNSREGPCAAAVALKHDSAIARATTPALALLAAMLRALIAREEAGDAAG